jgi:uncharacterized membrane protein YjgN (DUF898 family)
MQDNLEFRGEWTDLFANILLVTLLTALTLGIYFPWGYVRLRRVILQHTFYQGRPLNFDGTGGEFFGHCLVVLLLTLITLGFYALLGFASVRILRWDAQHTILPDGTRLEYRGAPLDLFVQWLIVGILTAITFGIYFFWGYPRIRNHIISNTFAAGQPLQFTGTGGQYFGVALVNFLLTTITLGIYSLLGFAAVRELKWDCENTVMPVITQPAAAVSGGQPIHVTVNVNQP